MAMFLHIAQTAVTMRAYPGGFRRPDSRSTDLARSL